MSNPSTIFTAKPRSRSPSRRLRWAIWRMSLQIGGERYRLRVMAGLAMHVLEHLQVDAAAQFVATIDATGARGYALKLETKAELPPVEKSALQVYLRRKIGELSGINLFRVPFEISVCSPMARLPIDEHEISSSWLRARLRSLEAKREFQVQAQRIAQGQGRGPAARPGRVISINTGLALSRSAANELR